MRTPLRIFLILFLFSVSLAAQTTEPTQEKSLGEVAREMRKKRITIQPADPVINDARWRISPENINVRVGEERELQLLDDSAQELRGAIWSVDDPEVAELSQKGDHVVVYPLAPGTVRVSALLDGETRSREIRIWNKIPTGRSRWGLHPIGREIGDLPAVPGRGPSIYSLEQMENGDTYLRADSADGVQLWTWLMPDKIHDVKLVCGDWLGGAIIEAHDAESYFLYAVGKDGNLRWRKTSTGVFRNLAISIDHVVYLLTSSHDGTAVDLIAIDESSGQKKFNLSVPSSRVIEEQVARASSAGACSPKNSSSLLPIFTTHVIVNMDDFAYLAFSQRTRTIKSEANCGGAAQQKAPSLTQEDELVLWKIHDDGTVNVNVIEAIHRKQSPSQPLVTIAPGEGLATDNMYGTLIPVESFQQSANGKGDEQMATSVYRVNAEGQLVFKSKMPQYTGSLHDGMVINSENVGFTTRGDTLIAFNIENGSDLWHWKSNTDGIEVRAALANGHCLVQTPLELVEVADSMTSTVVAEGKFILDWQGQLLKVHD